MTGRRTLKTDGLMRKCVIVGLLLAVLSISASVGQKAMADSCDCSTSSDVPFVRGMYVDKLGLDGEKCHCGLTCSDTFHIRVKKKKDVIEIRRSYLMFDLTGLTDPVESAVLSIEGKHSGGRVGVYMGGPWSCGHHNTCLSLPSLGTKLDEKDAGPGTTTFDITAGVNASLGGYLYLVLAMVDENSGDPEQYLDFTDPCITITRRPRVEVSGLHGLKITQSLIAECSATGDFARSLGKLSVSVTASTSYVLKIYYTVSPEPSPAFAGDPLLFEYQTGSGNWTTIPKFPNMATLPSAGSGDWNYDYPVEIDLVKLGDRKAGESFTFTVHVILTESGI